MQDFIGLIRSEITSVAEIPPAALDVDAAFLALGIESLQAVEIAAGLSAKLGRELPVTIFFDYPSIRELAAFLSGERAPVEPASARAVISSEPVAIIGLACRFPGAANSDEYWKNLTGGVDAISETPPARWNWRAYEKLPALRWGGFLGDIESFDNEMFGIPDPEAAKMDPQQRLLLECVHEAIENAGLTPAQLHKSRTGVFVGISSSDFSAMRLRENASVGIFDTTGNAHSVAANRISYIYNLRGPSLSVDTACSSSLVALHQAFSNLQSGECDTAIVAGVNVLLDPEISRAFAEAGMLAPGGRCKTFSREADGYVRGEGVGAVILQRASLAKKERTFALIRATAVNQDGKTNGLTAPSGPAQAEVIGEALRKAGLSPESIDFVEAHGTGTSLGDPIEFLTLAKMFPRGQRKEKLLVGSAKAFVGHLEAAAGMAGLIKTALSLKNRQVPKQIQFTGINPKMESALADLDVAAAPRSLEPGRVYRAGVSSFGFGGTNAHVVLESAPLTASLAASLGAPLSASPENDSAPLLLAFSSTHPDTLKAAGRAWAERLKAEADPRLLVQRSASERLTYRHRFAVQGGSAAELVKGIEAWERRESGAWAEREVPRGFSAKVAFAFTGQGSLSPGAGLDFAAAHPGFRRYWLEALARLEGYFSSPLLKVIAAENPEDEKLLYQTDYGQSLLFSLELAMARYLSEDCGVKPELVFGHSLGEISAACFAGSLSLADAARMVSARGMLMQEATSEGAMLSVRGNGAAIENFLAAHPQVELAARNGPDLFTLSGGVAEISAATKTLEAAGLTARRLPTTRAFHSRLMEPMQPAFRKVLDTIAFKDPKIPLVSSLTGLPLTKGAYNTDYWSRQLREPTQFLSMAAEAAKAGVNLVVEVGPAPVLSLMGPACVPDTRIFWIPMLNRKQPGSGSRALAELTLLGAMLKSAPLSATPLPPTPFRKRSVNLKKEKPVQSQVLAEIQALVAGLLHVKPDEVKVDASLLDLGADSLLLVNAIEMIKERYGVTIAVADIFRELNTVKAIAGFVVANQKAAPAPAPANAPASSGFLESRRVAEENFSALSSAPASTGNLRDIIEAQLALMNQQLRLLGAAPMSSPQPTQSTSQTAQAMPSAPSPQHSTPEAEAKGVLGNWRATANREVSADEKAKATYLDAFIKRFNARTPKTKAHTQKYRCNLADNRVSAGFRPNLKEMIYTIVFKSGKGAHFSDLDGNDYIDFTMGFGVNFFGHSPDFIEKRIRGQLEQGYCVGPQAELAGIVAEKACRLLKHERIAFLNSGTEAVMTALRLARAVTKRNRAVIFEGSYHGHADVVLARSGAKGGSLPVAPGVPAGIVGDVVVLPYGSEASLDYIRKHAAELAAVLVEPVQSRYPEHRPIEFLKELRAITQKSGTALVFDEVICGLRVSPAGAHELFGINPDLAVYGKVLGGGMPIGAVAGRAKFLDPIDGGNWQFGDDSYPASEMTFFAGTFCKHPVTLAAADAVLDRFLLEGKSLTDNLNQLTAKLCERLNKIFAGFDLEANNFGSLFRFKSSGNIDLLFAHLNLRGAYVWEGRNLFLSTAHTQADLDQFVGIVEESVKELDREGFLRKKP